MKKERITRTPKERKLNIQTKQEREERLKEWENLLDGLPCCECKKSKGEFLTQHDYVHDNTDYFDDALFVYESDDLLASHKTAFIVLYFCFLSNGRFKIHHSSSEHYRQEDASKQPITKYLYEASYRDSWAKGYELVTEILENFFSNKIPQIP